MEGLLDLLFTESPSGLVEIKKEAKLLEFVRDIIERDPGRIEKGEKVKEIARKELSYIFYYLKDDAFEGYRDDERKKRIRERVGLPLKWEADKVVIGAIKSLKEDKISKFEKLLLIAQRNLDDYTTLFEETSDYFRGLITILSDTNVEDLTEVQKSERKDALSQAQEHFKNVTTSVKQLQDSYQLIENLKEQIKTTKKKENKKRVSSTETNYDLYSRVN